MMSPSARPQPLRARSPSSFLSLLRIDGAKRLLLDTAESVTAICYEVGFQSLSSFSRRFKELVGLSPRDFRTLGTLDLTLAFDALPSRRPTAPRGLADQVVAPPAASADEATGLIVVGLFSKPVPDASPAACALLDRPGPYRLSAVSDGDYHLFASAMPPVDDPRALLVIEDKLRAGSTTEPVRIAGDQVDGSTRLELRAPRPEDPPILMVAPPLVRLLESFQAEETYAAASY
ncbi:MAG: helix-turn-helix transcriptional regulator [Planctomycetota bacterium]|nr:helix-turn-helix transcriptional regulator [Planctomycetota bacterium]